MADITIRHTMEDGTILTGSAKGDGVWEIAKANGFTYRRSVGIFLLGSRDKRPRTWNINSCAEALRQAGHTVEVELEEQMRPTAEREAALAERLEERRDALEAKADRRAAQSEARLGAARQTYDMIPMGQPILVGHHSERRHRKDLARAENNMRKGIELGEAASEAARKATASELHESYRQTGPVTERRIKKLEADERRWLRDMQPCELSGVKVKPEAVGRTLECRLCWNSITLGETVPDHGRRVSVAHAEQELATIREELGYWRAHLAELVDSGQYRKWGPDDFEKGDYVLCGFGWSEVLRVNQKSLTIPSGYSWTHTVGYDDVRGKRTKAEVEQARQKKEEEATT